jgi:hypothetical protein
VAPQLDRHDRQETGTGTSDNIITYRVQYPITLAYAWGEINIVSKTIKSKTKTQQFRDI